MTEQEKYGMDQLLKYLEMQINLKSDRIRMYKKQMDSNYLYYFAWAGKDLFKAYYMIEKYKELRQVLKKAKRPEEVHEYLQTERGKCVHVLNDSIDMFPVYAMCIYRQFSMYISHQHDAAGKAEGETQQVYNRV